MIRLERCAGACPDIRIDSPPAIVYRGAHAAAVTVTRTKPLVVDEESPPALGSPSQCHHHTNPILAS
jgi:hypothetical protein